MKRSLIAGLLSATVLASMAAPSFAGTLAQQAGTDGETVHLAQADFNRPGPGSGPGDGPQRPDNRERGDRRTHERMDRRGLAQGPHQFGLPLAGKLAAAEIYIGIKAGQEDVWRAYTSALIGFVEGLAPDAPARKQGKRGPGPNPGESRPTPPSPQSRLEGPQSGGLFAERMADRAIGQGEKARILKAAAEALRSALDDEQLARLARTERAFAPGPGMRGPHDGPHGGPGPHDRGPQPEESGERALQPAED